MNLKWVTVGGEPDGIGEDSGENNADIAMDQEQEQELLKENRRLLEVKGREI